jgi:hypothetical protein
MSTDARERLLTRACWAAALALALAAASGPAAPRTSIDYWPALPRKIAFAAIEKYGEPDRIKADSLTWSGHGPWKRTVAHRDGWLDRSLRTHADFLEQTIQYRVPDDRVDDLRRFDPRLTVDRRTRELSFRSNDEAMNFLALNLADEIVARWKTVEDAREEARKIIQLRAAGKKSPYLERFLFSSASLPRIPK